MAEHYFHIAVYSRGVFGVVDSDEEIVADWVGGPYQLEVRASSLRQALAKAIDTPLNEWRGWEELQMDEGDGDGPD